MCVHVCMCACMCACVCACVCVRACACLRYEVQAKIRSNSGFERMRLVRAINSVIGRGHTVDVDNPEVVILAEACMVGRKHMSAHALQCAV
jgi:hypothetical protein